MKNQIIFVLLTVLLSSSFIPKQSKDRIQNGSITTQNTPKIMYLFFKVEKLKTGEIKINLDEQRIVEGKLKSIVFFDEKSLKEGDFVVSLTDSKGKEIYKENVKDPLHPILETYNGEPQKHQLSLDEGEFSIRLPYSQEIQTVEIERISNLGNKKVFTQKLIQ